MPTKITPTQTTKTTTGATTSENSSRKRKLEFLQKELDRKKAAIRHSKTVTDATSAPENITPPATPHGPQLNTRTPEKVKQSLRFQPKPPECGDQGSSEDDQGLYNDEVAELTRKIEKTSINGLLPDIYFITQEETKSVIERYNKRRIDSRQGDDGEDINVISTFIDALIDRNTKIPFQKMMEMLDYLQTPLVDPNRAHQEEAIQNTGREAMTHLSRKMIEKIRVENKLGHQVPNEKTLAILCQLNKSVDPIREPDNDPFNITSINENKDLYQHMTNLATSLILMENVKEHFQFYKKRNEIIMTGKPANQSISITIDETSLTDLNKKQIDIALNVTLESDNTWARNLSKSKKLSLMNYLKPDSTAKKLGDIINNPLSKLPEKNFRRLFKALIRSKAVKPAILTYPVATAKYFCNLLHTPDRQPMPAIVNDMTMLPDELHAIKIMSFLKHHIANANRLSTSDAFQFVEPLDTVALAVIVAHMREKMLPNTLRSAVIAACLSHPIYCPIPSDVTYLLINYELHKLAAISGQHRHMNMPREEQAHALIALATTFAFFPPRKGTIDQGLVDQLMTLR